MISGQEALERLRRGNARYVADARDSGMFDIHSRRREVITGQKPFAVVLGCADSRVPPEIVFDHGLGDLFVIRVAGNIVAPSIVGSVEYAADNLGTRLVVVLGHSGCGAVAAALEYLNNPTGITSPNLRVIIDTIRPAIEPLQKTELRDQPIALAEGAVRANICASTAHLRHNSDLLTHLIESDGLQVVGAEYSLATGIVDFFDI